MITLAPKPTFPHPYDLAGKYPEAAEHPHSAMDARHIDKAAGQAANPRTASKTRSIRMLVEQLLPRACERLAVVDAAASIRDAAEMMIEPHTDLVIVCRDADLQRAADAAAENLNRSAGLGRPGTPQLRVTRERAAGQCFGGHE